MSFVIFQGRSTHGMGVISENTAYRSVSVSVSVSVDKFSFVLGIESIGKKWYRYSFNLYIENLNPLMQQKRAVGFVICFFIV